MGKIPPQPPCPPPSFSGNDYKHMRTKSSLVRIVLPYLIWIVAIGAVAFGVYYFCFCLVGSMDKRQAEQVSALAAKGVVCTVESVYSGRGGWEFDKVTFEGHAYATSVNRAFTHLESCPCKNVMAEKRP